MDFHFKLPHYLVRNPRMKSQPSEEMVSLLYPFELLTLFQEVIQGLEVVDDGHNKALENIIGIFLYGVVKWNTVSGFLLMITIFSLKLNISPLYVPLVLCFVDIYGFLNLLQNSPSSKYPHLIQNPFSSHSVQAKNADINLMSFKTSSQWHLKYDYSLSHVLISKRWLLSFMFTFKISDSFMRSHQRYSLTLSILLSLLSNTKTTP